MVITAQLECSEKQYFTAKAAKNAKNAKI